MPSARWARLGLLLLLLAPCGGWAQVIPPPSTPGTPALPATTCVNMVGVGLTTDGVLVCAPVTPALTQGLAASGVDVTPTGEVTSTHLSSPLPFAQGGLGLGSGTSGGLLYFASATQLASSPLLSHHAPVLGGGAGGSPESGTRSGTTTQFATVTGPLTQGKQLSFDPNGNVIASATDIGGGAAGGVTSVFGRTGGVTAQAGDYTAAQVTNAADLTLPNVFAQPQLMPHLTLLGTLSGTLSLRAAPTAGASLLRFPSGTTDFTATGAPGAVLRQDSAGGPLTVGPLAVQDLLGAATLCTTATLCPGYQAALGFAAEDAANKSSAPGLGTSNTLYPSQGAVKTYVDTGLAGKQATLGFVPEDVGNKSPSAVLGLSNVLYPTQGAVKTYVDSALAGKQNTLGFTPEDTANKSSASSLGASNTLFPTQGAVKSYVDTGLAGKQASLGFTPENVANKSTNTALGLSDTAYPSQNAVKSYVDIGLGTKQPLLGFTPENSANKSNAALGTSPTLYPTQGAVKTYVDAGLATKEALLTFGTGLLRVDTTVSVVSTQPGFLVNGGASSLVCGVSNQGKLQVLANGNLQYCDGAVAAQLRSGLLTQAGLTWNVTASACTGDGNGGKLTLNGSNEIVCASDIGGSGGGGGVTSVFGRTGAVVAQVGDYTAAQVTNAADLTAANVFTHPSGIGTLRVVLGGSTSGSLVVRAPAVAGTGSTLVLPGGSTDFSTTGGTGQVVQQTATGAALTVGPLSFSQLSGTATAAQVPTLPNLGGVLSIVKGGLNWTDTTFTGTTHTLATATGPTTLNKQLTYDAAGNIVASAVTVGDATNGVVSAGAAGRLAGYTSAGTTVSDTGIVTANVVTASALFTSGNLLQGAGATRVASDTGIAASSLCTTGSVCAGYQAALGFTPENVANKATSTSLGTSNTLYPSQNAVKSYVDTGLATKEATLTFSTGLTRVGNTISVASTQAGFLTDGGGANLTCGAANQGKLQVLDNGELQYCDGATTATLRQGLLTQSGLSWNVTAVTCTGDAQGGKLTIVGTQIVCAPDQGAPAASGDITDVGTCTSGACFTDGAPGTRLTYGPSAAPATPGTGRASVYVDSTSKNLAVKDDAGLVKHGVQTTPSTAGQFLAGINTDGSVIKLNPTKNDVGLDQVDNTSDAAKNSASVTLTNHRIEKRTLNAADATPIAVASDAYDVVKVAELSQATTFQIPTFDVTKPPKEGDMLVYSICTTTARTLIFTTGTNGFAADGMPLPTSSRAGGCVLYGFRWNSVTSKWVFVATNQATQPGFVHLPVQGAFLPANNPAQLEGSETNVRLLFDDGARECVQWQFRMPPDYAGAPVYKMGYSMLSATSGGIAVDVSLMAVTPGDTADVNTESYATANTCTVAAVPGTAGFLAELSCPLTNTDTLVAGDYTKLRLCRNTTHATDTATGDLEMLAGMLEYAR